VGHVLLAPYLMSPLGWQKLKGISQTDRAFGDRGGLKGITPTPIHACSVHGCQVKSPRGKTTPVNTSTAVNIPQSGICKLSGLGKWELQLSDTIGFWRKRLSFFSNSAGIFCSPVSHWQKMRQQLPERQEGECEGNIWKVTNRTLCAVCVSLSGLRIGFVH